MTTPWLTPMPGDRVLSIIQPWAWLIVAGHKPYENRTWGTAYRGPVWIHASRDTSRVQPDWLHVKAHDPSIPMPDDFGYGVIIGYAVLVGCYDPSSVPRPHWTAEGPVCWHFTDPQTILPVPCRGKLGLWTF